MDTPLLTNEYTMRDGTKVLFEYYESDSFDHLLGENIRQCMGYAFHGDKMLVVNNIKKAGAWTPVGGGTEKGEHPDATLVREIREESNMKVLDFKPIGYQRATVINDGLVLEYQLRYFCRVEPIGPFIADPDGDVTEVREIDPKDYKNYFDWGTIGDRIMERALMLKETL